MPKNTCDGEIYIHNLAIFIKSHEPQLANALVAYKKLNLKDSSKTKNQNSNVGKDSDAGNIKNEDSTAESSNKLKSNSTAAEDEETLTNELSKPVRLSLSLHHLYFILGKFKELGINIGPMNLRLDNIDSDTTANYVSFLSEFQRNKKIDSDSQSIHSISSVKSVMSSVSALWSTFGNTSKIDNTVSDLKYLYSAFSKLPCLRLANEPNAKLIEGHEEYPFETATPIVIFKNILVLEICDLDPKEIYGWNTLALRLRYLVVKKTNIVDPIELLVNLVDADSNVRGEDDVFTDNEDIHPYNSNDDEVTFEKSYSNHNNNIINHTKNKLVKSNSNISDSYDINLSAEKSSSLKHSSLSLSSTSLSKSQVLQPLHQSQSFVSSHNHIHNQHAYHILHPISNQTHTQTYNHYYNHHHPIAAENVASISTSPTTSLTSTYHPNRLYAEDILAANSQSSPLSSSVHSTRRSYYYNPQKKSRRSRGSTSVFPNSINNMTPIHSPTFNHHNDNTVKSSLNDNVSMVELHMKSSNDDKINTSKINDNNEGSNLSEKSSASDSYWKLLRHLSLTDNKIENVSLSSFDRLSNLTLLDLSYNRLTKLPSEPLAKLINLKTLNLSFNKLLSVEEFPRTLKKLTILNLRGNKISQLDSIENLSNLLKIDLRQNSLRRVADLKPLLLLNENKVLLNSVNLVGNPISKSRGYRVELFNLFNGVDYTNSIKIDGSRPGIFESRMLLDERTSKLKFKNYIDESIISKMTASVSNMNLSSILSSSGKGNLNPSKLNNTLINTANNNTNLTNDNKNKNEDNPNNNTADNINNNNNNNSTEIFELHQPEPNDFTHPVLDHMMTSIHQDPGNVVSGNTSKSYAASEGNDTASKELSDIGVRHNNSNHNTQPGEKQIHPMTESGQPKSPSLKPIRNPVSLSLSNKNMTSLNTMKSNDNSTNNISTPHIVDFPVPLAKSLPQSKRTSNDFSASSSILTANTASVNTDSNPITRLSLASPALPVITQATTTTMTAANNVPSSVESSNLNIDLTPKSVTSRKDYFTPSLAKDLEHNKENKETESKHISNDNSKLSNEDFSSGLKISVL